MEEVTENVAEEVTYGPYATGYEPSGVGHANSQFPPRPPDLTVERYGHASQLTSASGWILIAESARRLCGVLTGIGMLLDRIRPKEGLCKK